MSAPSGAPPGRPAAAPERARAAVVPADLLDGLFDPEVRWAASAIDADPEALAPAERKLVARAVAGRRREFAQGRLLARRLLAELGVEADALLRDDDRVPRWPDGAVGCISHTKGLCAVGVAPAEAVAGVGLDVEGATPLEPALWPRICTDAERRFLARDEARAGELAKAIFSVKECVYKACFPALRERWGFQELEVELDADAGRFAATPRVGALARRTLEGRVARRAGFWLAGFTWRNDADLAAERGGPA